MPFFDYPSVAREARIPDDKLQQLVDIVYAYYRGDDLLASLHVLRACHAVQDGDCTIEDAIRDWLAEAASTAHTSPKEWGQPRDARE